MTPTTAGMIADSVTAEPIGSDCQLGDCATVDQEGAQAIADSFSLRRTALTHNIPYYTTVAGARAAVQGIGALRRGGLEVAPLQSYF